MTKIKFLITVDFTRKRKAGDLIVYDKRTHFSIGKYSRAQKKYMCGVVVKQQVIG